MRKKQQLLDPVDTVDDLTKADSVSQAHLKQQKAVIQITEQALLSSNLSLLSKETIELAKSILHFDLGEILQLDPDHQKLHVVASSGWAPNDDDGKVRTYKPGFIDGFCSKAFFTGLQCRPAPGTKI